MNETFLGTWTIRNVSHTHCFLITWFRWKEYSNLSHVVSYYWLCSFWHIFLFYAHSSLFQVFRKKNVSRKKCVVKNMPNCLLNACVKFDMNLKLRPRWIDCRKCEMYRDKAKIGFEKSYHLLVIRFFAYEIYTRLHTLKTTHKKWVQETE